jgi:ankyrin repeat protein
MTTGSKSRRSSSDIWSLGIVFLEMTTVLRGKSLKDYDNYLAKNGTRSTFPSGNWVAANNWLEELIPHYPRTDNEPLQWIKEMIKMDPTTRPAARDLSSQIGQAMNGAWCGHCCNGDDSTESITTSEYESQHGDLPNELNQDLQPTVVPHDAVDTSRSMLASVTDAEQPFSIKTQSVIESPFSLGETMGQRMMDTFLNSLDEAEIPTPADIHNGTLPPPTSKEYLLQAHPSHIGHHEHSKHLEGATGLFGKVRELLGGDGDVGLSPIREGVEEDKRGVESHASRAEAHDNFHEEKQFVASIKRPAMGPLEPTEFDSRELASISTPVPDQGPEQTNTFEGQHHVSGHGAVPTDTSKVSEKLQKLVEKNVIPEMILDTWKAWAKQVLCKNSKDESENGQHCLVRTRSYEDIGRQTESILETRTFRHRDSERRASDDFSLPEYSKSQLVDFKNIKMELKEFTPTVTWRLPIVPAATIPAVSIETVEEIDTKKKIPQDPTAVIEKILPIEEIVPIEEVPPPAYSPPKMEATESVTSNSLKDALNQARAKVSVPTSGSLLTARNLSSLNAEPTRPKRVKVDLQTASVYMKRIHDDAASSVATSMLSTRTRERFKLAGLMLPLQDRSCRYLEQYCKEGKAAAVRLLLESGCEPGTIKRRRPGPIFNAVRGATMRHIKCVDALIAKGVNVNVKSQSNGRTPLHYAIEHQAWPGYMRLIYTLLKAGADPNIKDATGDVPLLQILYGGVEPLAEHKRDALAILLTNNFNTDLAISPPATKNTPLHLAVMHQDPWAVALLLNRDVAANKKNVAELTPLQLAAGSWSNPLSEDQMEILELLLERNAKVNVKDEGTWQTPVHTAVLLELDQVLKKLIACGGDINQEDHAGRSALDLFEEQKLKHNSGRVCKKCVKVQHVMNDTMFRDAKAWT